MDRHNVRKTVIQPSRSVFCAVFPPQIRVHSRFEIDRATQMQKTKLVQARRTCTSRAVLHDANPLFLPCTMRSGVSAVTRSACRNGIFAEHLAVGTAGPPNPAFLFSARDESLPRSLPGIPVFISHPRHTPVDIWGL